MVPLVLDPVYLEIKKETISCEFSERVDFPKTTLSQWHTLNVHTFVLL